MISMCRCEGYFLCKLSGRNSLGWYISITISCHNKTKQSTLGTSSLIPKHTKTGVNHTSPLQPMHSLVGWGWGTSPPTVSANEIAAAHRIRASPVQQERSHTPPHCPQGQRKDLDLAPNKGQQTWNNRVTAQLENLIRLCPKSYIHAIVGKAITALLGYT